MGKDDKTLAIVGLILNIIILPGLGTLIGGGAKRKKEGWWQLIVTVVAFILAIVLFFTVIIPIICYLAMVAMWIWALVSGIQMVRE